MANIYNLLITVIYVFVLRQFPTLPSSLEFFLILFALFAARKAINQQPSVLNYLDTGYFIANFSYPNLFFIEKSVFLVYKFYYVLTRIPVWYFTLTDFVFWINKLSIFTWHFFVRYTLLQDETFYSMFCPTIPCLTIQQHVKDCELFN